MRWPADWDDIRELIYEIETASDFLVIDNVLLAEGADERRRWR